MSLTLHTAARTHIGLVRRRNEDSAYAGQWLAAVADGLGGHVAGDTASNTVIDVLRTYDRQVDAEDLPTVLGRAIYDANEALRRTIRSRPDLAGMGTTLVALLLSGTTAALANVGDSRVYLLRENSGKIPQMTRVTEDHTYGNLVADAVDVPNLPDRIARFLDGRPDGRSPDLSVRPLQGGDRLLLCSDGLSAVVPERLITAALASPDEPGEAADRLVALALDHGGPDNITVIVVDVVA